VRNLVLIFFFVVLGFQLQAQDKELLKNTEWNAYVQLRASSNFNDNYGFMLRRLKFWIKSTPDFSEHWSYKVQAIFTSWMQEKFFLQDAKIGYNTGCFSFDIGQFIPRYSLQWTQPDYKISSIERAIVVNALHPNGSLGVRDIGMQANYTTLNNLLKVNIGVFNGYGIKDYLFNNQSFMITNRVALNLNVYKSNIQFGYSLMYRNASELKIPHVLPDSVLFTGNDFRYNFFALLKNKTFEFQTEFLNADFEGQQSYGYYFLSNINLKKHQIVLSYEYYKDLIDETLNKPYYRLGYNYLINKYKIKLYFDNFFQIYDNRIKNYIASVQLQVFFN